MIGWKPFSPDWATASARLRCFLPCQYLQTQGWPSEIFDEARLAAYQAVVFQKAYTEEDVSLALQLKKRNSKIVFDLCDNHFYRLRERSEHPSKLQCLETMMELADVVTVSTEALSELSPRKKTVVIDDAVDDFSNDAWLSRFIRRFGLPHHFLSGRARLVWFGNAGSEKPAFGLIDLAAIIPALNALNKTMGISLTVISNSKPLFKKHTREAEFPARFYQWNRETFRAVFQEHDACLLPITPNPFTVCKSNNRVLLSLLLGVPAVADRIPSYEEFSRWVPFSDWQNNLRHLLEHRKENQQRITEAASYIRENYGPTRVVRQWSQVFDRLCGGAKWLAEVPALNSRDAPPAGMG